MDNNVSKAAFSFIADNHSEEQELASYCQAIQKLDLPAIESLLKEGISLLSREFVGCAVLQFAAKMEVGEDNFQKITWMINLIRKKMFPQIPEYELSLKSENVFESIQNNDLAEVDRHFRRGEDVNQTDEKGWNCLHHAVINNNLELVSYLLRQGTFINLANDTGCSPLDFAKYLVTTFNDRRIYDVLLQYGAVSKAVNCDIEDSNLD